MAYCDTYLTRTQSPLKVESRLAFQIIRSCYEFISYPYYQRRDVIVGTSSHRLGFSLVFQVSRTRMEGITTIQLTNTEE